MGAPAPTYAWHVHHETLYEPLTEPIEKRIAYVKSNKLTGEQALRLKLMRPVKDQKRMADAIRKVQEAWQRFDAELTARSDGSEKAFQDVLARNRVILALHAKECEPDCPWDGETIFLSKVS